MTAISSNLSKPAGALARVPFYYGWVMLGLAALAMVGTFPGRTQGLGLITEPLLQDLNLDRVAFAQMNLWATLLGAGFCLGIGRWLDQFGSRVVLALVSLFLGGTVLMMSGTNNASVLFVLLVLSRGLGQSALSVISLTMVGQWFQRRLNLAMGIYTVLLSVGFMIAFPLVGKTVTEQGWRSAWGGIGYALAFGLTPLAILLVRRGPENIGMELDGQAAGPEAAHGPDFTWLEALWTPSFWVFALASSIYGLVASGIGLFNESILVERGFTAAIFHRTLVITALTSLVGNFLGGWLAEKWSVNRLMALAMALLGGALLALPQVTTLPQVYAFAVVMGLAGGFVLVIFFSFWAKTFGRSQLGRIQGTAQMMTVLASAVGPLLLAQCHAWTGSYATVFYVLAAVVAALAVAAWFVPLPRVAAGVRKL